MMDRYKHIDEDGDKLDIVELEVAAMVQVNGHGVRVHRLDRQAAAQALAGDGYRVISTDQDGIDNQPSTYVLLDLWQALGGDPADFDSWNTAHGSADTWGQLLHVVRRVFRPVCGKPVDGEYCVLTASESDTHICHGPSDVGVTPLPPIPAVAEDRPEPVDPATVRVGDVVEVEADDGSWMVRGEVAAVNRDYIPPSLLIHAATEDPCSVHTARTTVRVLRRAEPEPDPEQVEALAELIRDVGDHVSWHGQARELIRRGVRPPERQP